MFGRNQKKINSRIRFQNSNFKKQLEQARGYRRPIRPAEQNKGMLFLSKIGLGSRFSRIASLFVLFFLIYLVYVPNIFFIKQITINGSNAIESSGAHFTVNEYLKKYTPLPQKNLLALSKSSLQNYILKNNQWVLKVNKISKKFPNTLVLEITPRIDAFILQSSSTSYSVSSDGMVTSELNITPTTTLPQTLSLIKIQTPVSLNFGQQALNDGSIKFINLIQERLPEITKSSVNYFQLDSLQSSDLTVYLKTGYKIIFDFSTDLAKTLTRLKFLLSQLSDADIKRIFYVDLRFEDKGYLCNKGTACVNDINLPNNTTGARQ